MTIVVRTEAGRKALSRWIVHAGSPFGLYIGCVLTIDAESANDASAKPLMSSLNSKVVRRYAFLRSTGAPMLASPDSDTLLPPIIWLLLSSVP